MFRSPGGSFYATPTRQVRQASRCIYRRARWYGLSRQESRVLAFQVTALD